MKYDLEFNPPLMNAAGSLGFAPDPRGPLDLARLGAFVTNPVSLEPRSPARAPRYLPYPGGFLMHTGHPNPGLRAILRRYAPRWERSALPIVVHLLCQDVEQVYQMARRLESIEGIAAMELGLPPEVSLSEAIEMVRAASGERPLIIRLPLDRSAELASGLAAAFIPQTLDELAAGAGAEARLTAVSLGAPRGLLPGPNGRLVSGRLYGPAVFPLALAALHAVLNTGLSVIASGGVYNPQQVETLLSAGASAVQLDTVLWRGNWPP